MQRESGMPRSRSEAKAADVSAFRTHAQIHRGMQFNGSSCRLWSSYGGINEGQIDSMAERSVEDWCSQGGACK